MPLVLDDESRPDKRTKAQTAVDAKLRIMKERGADTNASFMHTSATDPRAKALKQKARLLNNQAGEADIWTNATPALHLLQAAYAYLANKRVDDSGFCQQCG